MKKFLVYTSAATAAVIGLSATAFLVKAEPDAQNIVINSAENLGASICTAHENGAATKEEVFEEASWNYLINNVGQATTVGKILLKDPSRRAARKTYIQTGKSYVMSNCPEVVQLPTIPKGTSYEEANPFVN
jgi:hypothetical protein